MTESVDLDLTIKRLASAAGWSSFLVKTATWEKDFEDLLSVIQNHQNVIYSLRVELLSIRRLLIEVGSGESTVEAARRVVGERNKAREQGYAEATAELAPYLHEEKP